MSTITDLCTDIACENDRYTTFRMTATTRANTKKVTKLLTEIDEICADGRLTREQLVQLISDRACYALSITENIENGQQSWQDRMIAKGA